MRLDTVADARVTGSGLTLLASPGGAGGYRLYRRAGASWQPEATLVPRLPAGLPPRPSLHAFLSAGPSQYVVLQHVTSTATAVTDVFRPSSAGYVLADQSRNKIVGMPWDAPLAETPKKLVIVAGPTPDQVFSSSNGGATWSPGTISGLPSSDRQKLAFGQMFQSRRGQLALPVFTTNADDQQVFVIAYSDDGGASFTVRPDSSLVLDAQYQAGVLPLSYYDGTVWLVAADGSRIFTYVEVSGAWSSTPTQGLGDDVSALDVVGDTQATAQLVTTSCPDGKASCAAGTSLVQTTDGGRTWAAV